MTLSRSQITMFTDWVNAGRQLNCDAAQFAARQFAWAYVNGGDAIGCLYASRYVHSGRRRHSKPAMQFHGIATAYTLNGASSVATLYTNPTTATSNPAVTLRSIGTNGGHAAAFAYDLATSIVYTRQGNPAWSAQERDGFYAHPLQRQILWRRYEDPQTDWVDLDTLVSIPQADEQQRLFAKLILQMNLTKKPLPRFWYFPRGKRAVVVMTGDDHGNGGTGGRFNQQIAASPSGCNVANWECVRSTSYMFVQPQNI